MQDPGTVSLVGDLMIRRSFAESGRGGGGAFRAAVAAMREADLVVGNLEMPLSRRGAPVPKWSNLRSDPEVIRDVKAMGIDAVTLANNHMCDYGPDGLLDTIAACGEAGVGCCGAGADLDAALAPARLRAAGVPVALLSVACTLPTEAAARAGKPGVAPIQIRWSYEPDVNLTVEQPGTMPWVHSWAWPTDQDTVCARIAGLRAQGDTVIVGIHWGVPEHWMSPFQGQLAEYQRPLGRALVDAGAEVVLGHHSHSLHPVEVYRGKPICYSVGNFLFEDPRGFMAPESVIVRATLGPKLGVMLVPVLIDAQGFPQLAAGQESRRVLGLLAELSAQFDTRFEIEGERARLILG